MNYGATGLGFVLYYRPSQGGTRIALTPVPASTGPMTATPIKGPVPAMVACEPYSARLTERICAKRWRIANHHEGAAPRDPRQGFPSYQATTLCTGCATGHIRNEVQDALDGRGPHPLEGV